MGAFIIVVGVGIFGTFTGYLANLFLSPSREPTAAEPSSAGVGAASKVSQLKGLMAQQQAAVDEIDLLLRSDGI
jgi:voltage-gated potassium channel